MNSEQQMLDALAREYDEMHRDPAFHEWLDRLDAETRRILEGMPGFQPHTSKGRCHKTQTAQRQEKQR